MMKIHPAPKKRNITIRYDLASVNQKKLRRLPHIFAKVLELPFSSDADVIIDETPQFLRFVVPTDDVDYEVNARAVEIYPGVTKIVIADGGGIDLTAVGGFGLDLWRFRLPASTLPELASAAYRDGELVVTVPKGGVDQEGADPGGVIGAGHLLLVQ